jgi:uncharacterized protein (DUF2236 family)
MTRAAPAHEQAGLGPDSLTWRFFGDTRMALVGPRAAVLQNMLPALGQGPPPVWRAVGRPLDSVARFITVGGMHPRMRELLGTPWSAADERRYRRFAAAVRALDRVWPVLPEAVRYLPRARRAFARERRRGTR